MQMIKDKMVLKNPEDAIRTYDDGACLASLYVPPYGDKQINEVIDVEYYEKGHYISYHYTDRGVQTLLLLKGSVEVTLYGKTAVCEAGDLINIAAHCPYSLRTLEDGCMVRGLYTGLNLSAKYSELEQLKKSALAKACQADFIADEYDPAHGYFALTEPVDTEKADKTSLHQITAKGRCIYEYKGWEGIVCQLKVGRWDLKNAKEIWQYTIDKGYQLQYLDPSQNERLYSVQSGKVKVEAGGEVFTAEGNDLIHIPVYTPFSLTALSAQAAILDLNVSARLFRMLEMLELAQKQEPEKTADPAWMKWLLDMNNSHLTGFSKA